MTCEIIHPAAFARPTDTDDPDRTPPAGAACRPGKSCEPAPASIPLTTPAGFRQRDYTFATIAAKLGLGNMRKQSSIVRIIRELIDQRQMPAPMGYRIRRAPGADGATIVEGAALVGKNAPWDVALFDAWQRGQIPAAQRAALDRREATAFSAALDRNAEAMHG